MAAKELNSTNETSMKRGSPTHPRSPSISSALNPWHERSRSIITRKIRNPKLKALMIVKTKLILILLVISQSLHCYPIIPPNRRLLIKRPRIQRRLRRRRLVLVQICRRRQQPITVKWDSSNGLEPIRGNIDRHRRIVRERKLGVDLRYLRLLPNMK